MLFTGTLQDPEDLGIYLVSETVGFGLEVILVLAPVLVPVLVVLPPSF